VATRFGSAVALLAIPALCFFLTPDIRPQGPSGGIDAFVYTGYMLNLHQLVVRFGETYYLLRMAVVVPGKLIYQWLGVENGFVALHYLQAVIGAMSIYLIASRFYGARVGFFGAVALCFSPWFLRSTTWNYVDGFALNYLFAGLAFIIVPRRRTALGHACGGFCFALATNSNLYTVAIWSAFIPPWFLLNRFTSWRPIVARMTSFLLGFLVAYALLAIAVNQADPGVGPFFELYTMRVAKGLLEGGSAVYFEPLGSFIAKGNYYVLVPAIIALGGAIFVLRMPTTERTSERGRAIAAFHLYLAIVIVVYLINHFAFHSPRITLAYYFCYLMVPTYLTLIGLVGELFHKTKKASKILLLAAMIALVLFWRAYALGTSPAVSLAASVALGTIFIAAMASPSKHPSASFIGALAFAVVIPAVFFLAIPYTELLDANGNVIGSDIYGAAYDLIKTVESTVPPSVGSVGFWFDASENKHSFLASLQSVYLYQYSLLDDKAPLVTKTLLRRVRSSRNIVILGTTFSEVHASLNALRHAGVEARVLAETEYDGQRLKCVELIARVSPPVPQHGALIFSIPLQSLKPVSALMPKPSLRARRMAFETDPRQWAYSLEANLGPRLIHVAGKVVVCARVRVIQGALGIADTKVGDPSIFWHEARIGLTERTHEYCLPPLRAAAIGYVVIRNVSPDGPSTSVIESVTIDKP
jgi:hypothetical protein